MSVSQAELTPKRAGKTSRAESLRSRLFETRRGSLTLARPLSDEDQTVQAMDDTSPAKWHLAHTTWFFEAFLLLPFDKGYAPFSEDFTYCFNSYYEGKGARQPRPSRGLMTRPGADEVRAYRAYVDEALELMLEREIGRAHV